MANWQSVHKNYLVILFFDGLNEIFTGLNVSELLEITCERECSRGEDYRLIKLSIIDYSVRLTIVLPGL
jgi:hypothetical protein